MDALTSVTDASFEAAVVSNPRPVIVEYWAQWCGPCRQVGPVLGAIAQENADLLDVVKLNVDENPETVRRYRIMLLPPIGLFRGGRLVKEGNGRKVKVRPP